MKDIPVTSPRHRSEEALQQLHLCLTLHEAVAGNCAGKFFPYVLASISEAEGLEVTETVCMGKDESSVLSRQGQVYFL